MIICYRFVEDRLQAIRVFLHIKTWIRMAQSNYQRFYHREKVFMYLTKRENIYDISNTKNVCLITRKYNDKGNYEIESRIMFYLDSEVASLYRSLSCKNFSTFGFVASKMSRHSNCSNACNTSPKVPPSCMYISSIAFVRPSFGRTQVSTHCREIKKKYVKDDENLFHFIIYYHFIYVILFLCTFVRSASTSRICATSFHCGKRDAYL